jgi:hypothetical protein
VRLYQEDGSYQRLGRCLERTAIHAFFGTVGHANTANGHTKHADKGGSTCKIMRDAGILEGGDRQTKGAKTQTNSKAACEATHFHCRNVHN